MSSGDGVLASDVRCWERFQTARVLGLEFFVTGPPAFDYGGYVDPYSVIRLTKLLPQPLPFVQSASKGSRLEVPGGLATGCVLLRGHAV